MKVKPGIQSQYRKPSLRQSNVNPMITHPSFISWHAVAHDGRERSNKEPKIYKIIYYI